MKEADLKLQIKDYLNIKHIFSYHNLQGIGSYAGLHFITFYDIILQEVMG